MKLVVAASVLVAALVDQGPVGIWALALVAEGELAAPDLVLVESTHALRRLERIGRLSRLEATAALRDLLDFDLELIPFAPCANRVWELRPTVTSYDAWYIAVAEAFDVPLATLDERLIGASGPRCAFLRPPDTAAS